MMMKPYSSMAILFYKLNQSSTNMKTKKKNEPELFNEGFIQLHRRMLKWEWYDDPNTFRLFIHCLFLANWKDKKWHGILIKRGSFITSVKHLSLDLGLSAQNVRTSLDKLKLTNELTIKTTSKYTVVTVNNYVQYQDTNKQTNKRLTNHQQTTNKQLTTTNKDNKENKDNNKDIDVFISHFNKSFNAQYRTTTGRYGKLKARLQVFKMDELLNAVDNLAKSKFHKGDNDRGWVADPDFILRSDEQIDKWNVKTNTKEVVVDDLTRRSREMMRKRGEKYD